MNQDSLILENSKILRSIWKNTFDKILEIKVANKRSWTEMKSQIMIEEQKKIDEKYNKQYNEEYIQNKIEISKARNEANLEKMKTKNDFVDKIVEETLNKLEDFAQPNNQAYKNLLKDLIVESMVKMIETQCYVQVRQSDLSYVSSILSDCEKEYSKVMREATGRDYSCKLVMDDAFIEESYGGIKLLSKDKKIILGNDLHKRLLLTKEKHLPIIKNMLFPKESKK